MYSQFLKKYSSPKVISRSQINMNVLVDDEMALSEHIEEFSQRLVFCLVFLLFATIVCFADVKKSYNFPSSSYWCKILQFSPGNTFASVKIAVFCGSA